MSDPSDSALPPPAKPAPDKPAKPRWRRPAHQSLLLELAFVLGLAALILIGVRYGAETPPGRALITAYLDGVNLGPWGKLHVRGLRGDVWSTFSIEELSVSDSRGPWLDMRGLAMTWRPAELWRRRFHAQSLTADTVRLIRRPILKPQPKAKPGPNPLAVSIDNIRATLRTDPAFSTIHGLYRLDASLDMERKGGFGGGVDLVSLTRAGDGAHARFDLGVTKHLLLDVTGSEAAHGALAGMLGLSPERSLSIDAHADGSAAEGLFRGRVISGDQTPAAAEGGWTKDWVSGQARLTLAASTLTSGWAEALGPEVKLEARGRGEGPSRYRVVLQAQSENLALGVAGLIEADKQAAPAGLALSLRSKDLPRLLGAWGLAQGQITGRLSGDRSDWRLAGTADLQHVSYFGYTMAQVSGPLTLSSSKGDVRLQVQASGRGGEGRGLVAALAGANPKATLDGTRLADGRLLVRDLTADGLGLKLTATGERGLLGGLSFKGQAQFSNLAAAHQNAHGQILSHWTASQGAPSKPWAFNIDAQGADLASGGPDLDHLLGSKPVLHIETAYEKGVFSTSNAHLSGAAASVDARGQVGVDGTLKLLLAWNAQGPLSVGPLDIAGKATGSGALTGTFAAPRADLIADFERLDLPALSVKPAHMVLSFVRSATGDDGSISLTGGGEYGPAHAKALFSFVSDGVTLRDLDAVAGGLTAQGSITLRRGEPSMADLALDLKPGAFITQGHAQANVKIADQPGGAVADIRLTAERLVERGASLAVNAVRLSARGPLARMPYVVKADGAMDGIPLSLDGGGIASQAPAGYTASFQGSGRVRKAEFITVAPAQFTFGGPTTAAKLDLNLGGGHAQLDAHRTPAAVDAKFSLKDVDLRLLEDDLVGRIDAEGSLNGDGPRLNGQLDAHLTGARSRDAPSSMALDGAVHASLADSRLSIQATGGGAQNSGEGKVNLDLAADAGAAPLHLDIDPKRPMSGHFDIDGEIQPIWDLFFGGQSLSGRLSAHGTLGGSLNDPRIDGQMSLSNGKLEDIDSGLKLHAMKADADFADNLMTVRDFSATDAGSGAVTGDGRLSLTKGGSSTLTLNLRNFRLVDNENAKANASGAVTVTRSGQGAVKLSGALTIDRADISAEQRGPPGVVSMDVVERNAPIEQASQGLRADTSPNASAALDVQLQAARGVFIRGLGLNAEMSLDAHVTGTTDHPVMTGAAHVIHGDYDFAGKRFTIDDQGKIILASDASHIRLDLSASWQDPSLIAIIKITGTAAKPEIALTSTPTLPSDEILAEVLFGQSAAQLSPVEAAQLAAAVTTLATGGGFDVMGGLRSFARLDRLALGGDAAAGVTVSGGKYIGEHVYLELTGGGRQGPSAQVEVRVNKAWSFVSLIGGQLSAVSGTPTNGAQISVRWHHDYGAATDAKPAGR